MAKYGYEKSDRKRSGDKELAKRGNDLDHSTISFILYIAVLATILDLFFIIIVGVTFDARAALDRESINVLEFSSDIIIVSMIEGSFLLHLFLDIISFPEFEEKKTWLAESDNSCMIFIHHEILERPRDKSLYFRRRGKLLFALPSLRHHRVSACHRLTVSLFSPPTTRGALQVTLSIISHRSSCVPVTSPTSSFPARQATEFTRECQMIAFQTRIFKCILFPALSSLTSLGERVIIFWWGRER